MKNIMFGNSLMLLSIFLFMWCGFMKSMYVLMWVAIALILIGFIMAIVGYISKDKEWVNRYSRWFSIRIRVELLNSNLSDRWGGSMKKLYNFLKYVICASFYVIVIKISMDFYKYKRFPNLYSSYSAPWYTEALLYSAASFAVIIVCIILRVFIRHKMDKK